MAEYLNTIKPKYPVLGEVIERLALCALNKQIHELTTEIIRSTDLLVGTLNSADLAQFLSGFVSNYASRMNPVDLLKFSSRVALSDESDGVSVIVFLEKYMKQIDSCKDAVVLFRVLRGEVSMKKQGNLVAARTEIDSIDVLLNDPVWSHAVSGYVCGLFHLVAAELFLSLGNNDLEFYSHLVKYMRYSGKESVHSDITKQAGVIALVHPEINDFGELLSLSAFSEGGSSPAWITDLLRATHQGDFQLYNRAIELHKTELSANNAELYKKIEISVKRKLTMIALSELAAFKTPEKNRRLTFSQIAQACHVPITEVETLLMTTMGTGLVTGVIDQVESTVVITSVKPRMLNPDRIMLLQSRINGWANRAQILLEKMSQVTPQLLLA